MPSIGIRLVLVCLLVFLGYAWHRSRSPEPATGSHETRERL